MTPEKRAERILNDMLHLEWQAQQVEVIAAAIAAAERTRVAAERAIPGAPLTEEQLASIVASNAHYESQLAAGRWEEDEARNHRSMLLAERKFFLSLLADAAAHGELEQGQSGRDAGLEEAAKLVPSPKLAEIIRAFKRK